MTDIDQQIVSFCTEKGADKFWTSSMLNALRGILATNSSFVTKVTDQKVRTDKHGGIKSYEATVERIFPDAGNRTESKRLLYKFNPKIKFAHKAWLTDIE